jgi:hypothetical protein
MLPDTADGGALEEDPQFVGGLPDGFEFAQAQEPGQGESVALICLSGCCHTYNRFGVHK